jgi:gas vesicle structural protein
VNGARRARRKRARRGLVARADTSLLDVIDRVLNKGVVLTGDVVLGVADVDLIYLRLSALFAAADRVFAGRKGGA